jgi:GT2 family glycosyltransferase
MKFEQKHPDYKGDAQIIFNESAINRIDSLSPCAVCKSLTCWFETQFQVHICSEECFESIWKNYYEETGEKPKPYEVIQAVPEERFKIHTDLESECSRNCSSSWKDILVVVHDQVEYLKICIDSVRENTKNFNLYIWDNDSDEETKSYIESLLVEYDLLCAEDAEKDWTLNVTHSDVNLGFIEPNNEMARWGSGEYLILLNSDTKVFPEWDTTMIGLLENNSDLAQVGFGGGIVDETGKGIDSNMGYEIDFISGWCFCISRVTYDKFNLFNNQLEFAYCEDSDFSFRLKEAGKQLYAIYSPLVYHYGNKTIEQVAKDKKDDILRTFNKNHDYIKNRWESFLRHNRVLSSKVKFS